MSSRTLIVGDVHGCSIELSMLIEKTRPTRCILVGDVFRKGPDSIGVWNLIKQHKLESVLGNHELVVLQNREAYPVEVIQWIHQLPLWIEGEVNRDGFVQQWRIVHAGVDPINPNDTTQQQAVSIRRYTSHTHDGTHFWWQLYTGEQLILYGHDAKRGVQDHRPKTLGLDSGCVYGHGLTAYLLEEDRLVHIPSERVYVSVE